MPMARPMARAIKINTTSLVSLRMVLNLINEKTPNSPKAATMLDWMAIMMVVVTTATIIIENTKDWEYESPLCVLIYIQLINHDSKKAAAKLNRITETPRSADE